MAGQLIAFIAAVISTAVAALPGYISYIIAAALVIGASYGIAAALAPSIKSTDGQLVLQQPIPFRRRVYGRAKIGGFFIYWDSSNGTFYALVAVAAHEIDAFEEHWLGDRRVVLDGSGFVTAVDYPPNAATDQFNHRGDIVQIVASRGEPGKTYNTVLAAAYPGIWTSDHIGTGIADVLIVQGGIVQKWFSQTYPGGPQPYRGLIRGAKIIDPRVVTSPTTAAWTDNAACVLRDYLTNQDGWRIDPTFFDTGTGAAITAAAADICDETVALKDGGTEKRYRIWGFYDFNEEPRAVLARFLAACGGWLEPQKDGTIAIHAGKWITPTVTLSDDIILSYDVQHYQGEFDAINEIRANFTDPDNDYQDTESIPWDDDVDIARRGYIKSTTIDARHCPSYQQTRRVQKIGYHEIAPEWTITLTTTSGGLNARNQRFVNLVISELSLSITCRITSFVVNIQSGVCTIGLSSFGSDAYDWSPSTEEGPQPILPVDTSDPGVIETPANMAVDVSTHSISNGVDSAIAIVSCDQPTDRSDLDAKFEYQVAGTSAWTVIPTGTLSYVAYTQFLPDGTYNFRGSFIAPGSAQSEFVFVNGVIIAPATVAPDAPTNLVVGAPSPPTFVHITFTMPNSANAFGGRAWRNSSSSFSGAVDVSGLLYGSPNQNLSYDDTPAGGTWYYWATAENSAGDLSGHTGPQHVTTATVDGSILLDDSVAGSGKTYTFPADATPHADIELTGVGGNGNFVVSGGGGKGGGGSVSFYGGGAAGYSKKVTVSITAGVTQLTYTLGTHGNASTLTITGGAFTLTANHGVDASTSAAGAGGTASGGSTNTTGHSGGLTNTWDGGGAAPDFTDNTTNGTDGSLPGQGGAGAHYDSGSSSYIANVGAAANVKVTART